MRFLDPIVVLRRWLSLGLACSLVVGLMFAGSASAATYFDGYGAVAATLTDQGSADGGLTLDITRAAVDFTDSDFTSACAGYAGCSPTAWTYGGPVVAVRRASGSNEPDVFVHLSNGGNICCRSTVVYHYDASTSTYVRRIHIWGDAADSGSPRSLGQSKQVYFVSSDGRFRYVFGCGACTPQPIQIWQDQAGRLVDVTRRFPALIRKDAAKWRRLYFTQRAAPYGADGILVAYVADEQLLRRGHQAWQLVYQQGSAGYLTRPGSGFATPHAFYKKLRSFLRRLHYTAP